MARAAALDQAGYEVLVFFKATTGIISGRRTMEALDIKLQPLYLGMM